MLLNHPAFSATAAEFSNAARFWCADCLAESAFARHRDVKKALAEHADLRATQRAEEAEAARIREAMDYERATNGLALRMYDRANTDPAFASALRLAVSALDAPRADLEAVM